MLFSAILGSSATPILYLFLHEILNMFFSMLPGVRGHRVYRTPISPIVALPLSTTTTRNKRYTPPPILFRFSLIQ